jgi:hypothetical protein
MSDAEPHINGHALAVYAGLTAFKYPMTRGHERESSFPKA